jgi:hypothetical protein
MGNAGGARSGCSWSAWPLEARAARARPALARDGRRARAGPLDPARVAPLARPTPCPPRRLPTSRQAPKAGAARPTPRPSRRRPDLPPSARPVARRGEPRARRRGRASARASSVRNSGALAFANELAGSGPATRVAGSREPAGVVARPRERVPYGTLARSRPRTSSPAATTLTPVAGSRRGRRRASAGACAARVRARARRQRLRHAGRGELRSPAPSARRGPRSARQPRRASAVPRIASSSRRRTLARASTRSRISRTARRPAACERRVDVRTEISGATSCPTRAATRAWAVLRGSRVGPVWRLAPALLEPAEAEGVVLAAAACARAPNPEGARLAIRSLWDGDRLKKRETPG